MKNKSSLLVLLTLLVAGQSMFGSDLANTRATLRGLKGIYVAVEELDSDVEAEGVNREQLQSDVERRLRNSGITLLKEQNEYLSSMQSGLLYINVNSVKNDTPMHAICIEVSLKQRVLLERDLSIKTLATTWSSDEVTLEAAPRISSDVRNLVLEHVDKFLDAYLSANRK